jgi:hypothetical protein
MARRDGSHFLGWLKRGVRTRADVQRGGRNGDLFGGTTGQQEDRNYDVAEASTIHALVLSCWRRSRGRRANWLDDLRSAGAGYPDLPVVSPAIQVAAPLVLSDKGHQSVQHIRHTPSRTRPLSASPQQGSAGRRV